MVARNVAKIAATVLGGLAIGAGTMASANAARIYNHTSYAWIVACPHQCGYKNKHKTIVIKKGERSPSLHWGYTVNHVQIIMGDGEAVCEFNFGLRNHMQGGNYAVITDDAKSYLYDSNDKIIAECVLVLRPD